MKQQTNQNGNSGIIIVAVVAIIALIIGWTAFNRSGENVIPTAQNQLEDAARVVDTQINEVSDDLGKAAEDMRLASARTTAQTELAALEVRAEADEDSEVIAQEIAEIRADLNTAYNGASAQARQEWTALSVSLTNLEEEVRSGTATALESFGELLISLGGDVRTDI